MMHIKDIFSAQIHLLDQIKEDDKTLQDIKDSINIMTKCLKNGGKVLLCGNGGSAADAQHFATELTARFKKNRGAISAIALTTDTSAITAIGNDFGFNFIFSRQIEAIANSGDVLIAISTSGNSSNIIEALKKSKEMFCINIGLTGKHGGNMRDLCNVCIKIPSEETARIQEAHLMVEHIFSEALEDEFS